MPQPSAQEPLRRQGQDGAVEALEHPLQSLVIAAGIGLLVGLLQRRE